MSVSNQDKVYQFGKDIVIEARDNSIENLNMLFARKSKSNRGKLFELISHLPEDVICAIKNIILYSIDDSFHSILGRFDKYSGKYRIVVGDIGETAFDIVEESDGLAYGLLEFIDEYSKYNTADEFLATGKLEKD